MEEEDDDDVVPLFTPPATLTSAVMSVVGLHACVQGVT